MLKQPILSLFVRMIPEAFLVIYAIYRITNTKVNMKRIILFSILGGMGAYVARMLPIHFGVHTILCVMMYIFLAVALNKIDIYKAIATALVIQIILFVSDFILAVIYTRIFMIPSDVLFGQTWTAAVSGVPPLILFYLLILTIVYVKKKRGNHEYS